jgi:hypothetical protein
VDRLVTAFVADRVAKGWNMTHDEQLELSRRAAEIAGRAEILCLMLNICLHQIKDYMVLEIYEEILHQTDDLYDDCNELTEFMLSLQE